MRYNEKAGVFETPAKHLLIIFSIPINPRTRRALIEWKAVKDLVRGILGEQSQPDRAEFFPEDERIASCEVRTSQDAHRAFCILNGYNWNGTVLGCIVQYPNGRWLVHHSTDPARAPPLTLLRHASPGQWSPFPCQQVHTPLSAYDQRHRNLSVSSVSSSSGGASPPPTRGTLDHYPHTRNRTQLCMAPDFIDAFTGDLIPSNGMAGYNTDLHPSHWHRALHINNLVPYQAKALMGIPAQPRPDVMIDKTTIMIRELSRNVDQARLTDFLGSQNLRGRIQSEPDDRRSDGKTPERRRRYALVEFATNQEAVEAVHRLHGRQLVDRCLNVKMAKDGRSIQSGSRERAGSIASDVSTASSSVATMSTSGRQHRGPIIADGSV